MNVELPPVQLPFIERLVGTIRREFSDQTLFWNAIDLGRKMKLSKAITTFTAPTVLWMVTRLLKPLGVHPNFP